MKKLPPELAAAEAHAKEMARQRDAIDTLRPLIPGIEAIAALCHDYSKANGFWDHPLNVGEKLALIHSEVSEALEADRKGANDDKIPAFLGLEAELADALIRIFDLAGGMQLDLIGALYEKMFFNTTRPYKHGKKY